MTLLLISAMLACVSVAPCEVQGMRGDPKVITVTDLAMQVKNGWDLSLWMDFNIEYVSDRDPRSGLNRDKFVQGNVTLKSGVANCRAFAILAYQVLTLKGYECHILVSSPQSGDGHAICVYKNEDYYSYISNGTYHRMHAKTLESVARDVFDNDDWNEFDDEGYIVPRSR